MGQKRQYKFLLWGEQLGNFGIIHVVECYAQVKVYEV